MTMMRFFDFVNFSSNPIDGGSMGRGGKKVNRIDAIIYMV